MHRGTKSQILKFCQFSKMKIYEERDVQIHLLAIFPLASAAV